MGGAGDFSNFWAILTCCVRTAFPQGDFLRARNGAFDAIKSRMACSALLPCALRAAPRRRGFSIAVGSALGVRCSEKQQDLCNHPTSDYKSGWLFFKFQQFLCITCSTIESVEAVQNGGPAKAQRSGFGGERRSSGTTELLPRKAKRRMWSLRRRGTPFSPIFRRATKDGATGGRE